MKKTIKNVLVANLFFSMTLVAGSAQATVIAADCSANFLDWTDAFVKSQGMDPASAWVLQAIQKQQGPVNNSDTTSGVEIVKQFQVSCIEAHQTEVNNSLRDGD